MIRRKLLHTCMDLYIMFQCWWKITRISDSSLVKALKDMMMLKQYSMYFQKSNKWDSAQDVLHLEHRQGALKHCEREKRMYNKRNAAYWEDEITETRKNRWKHVYETRKLTTSKLKYKNNLVEDTYSKMNVKQLRQEIKSKEYHGGQDAFAKNVADEQVESLTKNLTLWRWEYFEYREQHRWLPVHQELLRLYLHERREWKEMSNDWKAKSFKARPTWKPA